MEERALVLDCVGWRRTYHVFAEIGFIGVQNAAYIILNIERISGEYLGTQKQTN